ncbi:hypothetical protein [Rhodopirellula bahusiensis]|nr:hypothetical protein [Rhodopirellula bahusiensis]
MKATAFLTLFVAILLGGSTASNASNEGDARKLTITEFVEVADLKDFLFEHGRDSLTLTRCEIESSFPRNEKLGTIHLVGDSRHKRIEYRLPLVKSNEMLVLTFSQPTSSKASKLSGFWIDAE